MGSGKLVLGREADPFLWYVSDFGGSGLHSWVVLHLTFGRGVRVDLRHVVSTLVLRVNVRRDRHLDVRVPRALVDMFGASIFLNGYCGLDCLFSEGHAYLCLVHRLRRLFITDEFRNVSCEGHGLALNRVVSNEFACLLKIMVVGSIVAGLRSGARVLARSLHLFCLCNEDVN